MGRFSKIATAVVITSTVDAFVYEFKKDPIPNSGSYWVLGQVTVARSEDKETVGNNAFKQRPEISFDLKTVVDNIKNSDSLSKHMEDVSVGITETWITDNVEEDVFCCNGPDAAKGCLGTEFSLASKGGKHKTSSYAISLKEASDSGKKLLTPLPGQYHLWIANCAKEASSNIKLAGSVKVKSAHGYLPVESLLASKICYYLGFGYLLFTIGLLFYPFASSTKPLAYALAAVLAINSLKALVVVPFQESRVNQTGDPKAGMTNLDVMLVLQLCGAIGIWDMVNSQYFVAGQTMTTTDKLGMGASFVALFGLVMGLSLFFPESDGRPSEEFFDAAKTGASYESPMWNFQSKDLYGLGALTAVLVPIGMWSERREKTMESSDFSALVMRPLRGKITGLICLCLILLVSLDLFRARGANDLSGISLELSYVVERCVPEALMLTACLTMGYYITFWDKQTATKYGTLEEVELETMEEVDNYDPDKLGEARVQLE